MNQPNNSTMEQLSPLTPSKKANSSKYRPTNLIIPSVVDEHHIVTVTCLTNNSSVNSGTCHGNASMTPSESCQSSCLSSCVSSPFTVSAIQSPTTLLNQHEKDFYNSMGFELIKSGVAKGITSTINLVRKVSSTSATEEVAEEQEISTLPTNPSSDSYSKPDQYPISNVNSLSPDNEDLHESLYEESSLFAEKVISLNSEHTNHSLTDIEREERCLLKCASSPYIVNLYKSTRSSKYHHRFFLEYIDGCTIADLIEARDHICEKELALIAQQLLRALVFLKEKGLLHRDIKSENIMLCKNGCVKLIDLGLAIELDQANRDTSPNSGSTSTEPESVITKGTYSFMCPNKLLTGKESFDSDLYSLGMTLLELFIGRLPFDFDQSNTDGSFPLADIVSFDIEEYCTPLVDSGRMSYELKSFLCLCMDRDCEMRANVHSLLSHDFLSHTFEMSHNELCSTLKEMLNER